MQHCANTHQENYIHTASVRRNRMLWLQPTVVGLEDEEMELSSSFSADRMYRNHV